MLPPRGVLDIVPSLAVWKRVLLVALVIASAAVAWLTGLHEKVEVETLRELVAAAGVWGPVLFVLLFGLEGIGFPGVVFMLAAIALWPFWLAFLLNWLGGIMAGIVGFSFARYVGRDWVADKLPPAMRRFEKRVVEKSVQTVILVRLLFFLAPWAHWALGLSPVSFRAFLLGTAIGFAPAMALVTYFGAQAFAWLADQPAELWMGLAGAFLVGVLLWRWWARQRAALADAAR